MLARFLIAAALLSESLQAAVPPPASHFGHAIGADRQLLDWNKVVGYFDLLARSSDRIVVRELGKTAEGRPFIAAWISSPETLRNLDKYREIQARLADPRRTTPAEAREFIAQGKTVVLITCSIHATEVASTHTAVEFAYRLLTEDRPKFRAILDNTIFILVPSLNPDGVDIVTRWYRSTLGTEWEGTSPPELYHKYVGHDNNRDWYIFSQPETRHTISQLHNVWHPQIVYDVHQQGAYASRIFVPPWMDPVDPNIDPIIAQLCNAVGSVMAADLTAAGRQGVAVNAMYDFWSAARHYQAYHGGLRILSESASASLATPITVRPDQIQSNALGYNPQERSWNYLEPWKGGVWTLRDIIDDQSIAIESCLYQAAIRREDFLRAFYEVGRRQIARISPYAFVIPGDQFDPGSAKKLVETLVFGQVEVERAVEPFEAAGRSYKKGSWVVRLQQPYGGWAKTLLERQNYPDLRLYPGGPPKRPYDVTAQTLPMLMGVRVDTIERPFSAHLERSADVSFVFDRPVQSGAMPASDAATWKAIGAAWQRNEPVFRDSSSGEVWLRQPPSGRGVQVLPRPRIGLFRSHVPAMDEGWTRWLFENFQIPYVSLKPADINAGNLHQNFDVIVFPDQAASSIADGYRPGTMPAPYTGGIGSGDALKDFVNQGGTVIFLNHSTDYAVETFGLKVKNVVRGLTNRDFYSPGSILVNTLDLHHPLAAGMPENVFIWSEGSPAWDVPADAGTVVARYPAKSVLASGWLLGEKYIAGKAALVDVTVGAGHVVLFGMRPQYRAQSYGTFKLLFNALTLGRTVN